MALDATEMYVLLSTAIAFYKVDNLLGNFVLVLKDSSD